MGKICFVIMPIGEYGTETYNHFLEVYEELFIPSIEMAGYFAKRSDQEKACNMIQYNIIQNIIDADMVLCDLSNKNPNVLYELGIRQAFDLPVVLVQEYGTPRIFDINTIRTIDYDKGLNARKVKESIKSISDAIIQTSDVTSGINSLIGFLQISKELKKGFDKNDSTMMLNALLNKVDDLADRQDGIYEILSNIGSNEVSETISERWNSFFTKYSELSRELTSLIYKYSNDHEYPILQDLENIYEIIQAMALPTAYNKDLQQRYYAYKWIIKNSTIE